MTKLNNSLIAIAPDSDKELEIKQPAINCHFNIENECFEATNHLPDPDPERGNNKLLIGFCSFILALLAFNIWSQAKPTQSEVQNALESTATNVFIAFVKAIR